ncbi:MAG TPA: sulfate transporter family protein [Xanthobacteraceae bacterium]|jgi:CysZ protein
MIAAAAKAFAQMLTPPFRKVLLKSVGLALLLVVLLGFGLHRSLIWLTHAGEVYLEGAIGPASQGPLSVLFWILSIAAGLGIVLGAVFLMPAVTAFVGSFFVDEIAEHVEREYYPEDRPGEPLPVGRALWEGSKTALLAVGIYLCALPLLLFAGIGLFVMFFATSYLLGREYFELAAMRFRPVAEAKAFRRSHRASVFVGGMVIGGFVSIPIVNLATPLFAMAFMVHLHKHLSRERPADRRW